MSDLRVGILIVETLDERARDSVALAAAAGIDHIATIDHVSFHGGEGIDGLITAAALAGLHPTIDLYVGVYQLPLRHPVMIARQLSTLAHFAPGRITFGVGVGGEEPQEFRDGGVDLRTRGRRATESLWVIRHLLAGEVVDFDGDFFQLRGTRILPVPHPPIPLIVGGRSNAALQRAAELGDGWIGLFNSPRRCREAINMVADRAERIGRGSVGWQHGMAIWCGFGRTAEEGRTRLEPTMAEFFGRPFADFERYSPTGSPEQIAEVLAQYAAAGCQTFNLIPIAASVEDAIDGVTQVKRALVGTSVGR